MGKAKELSPEQELERSQKKAKKAAKKAAKKERKAQISANAKDWDGRPLTKKQAHKLVKEGQVLPLPQGHPKVGKKYLAKLAAETQNRNQAGACPAEASHGVETKNCHPGQAQDPKDPKVTTQPKEKAMAKTHPHGHPDTVSRHDPRDVATVDFDEVNNKQHYALYTVWKLAAPLPADDAVREALVYESVQYVAGSGASTRGWYDLAGFRAGADLLIWWLNDDPKALQDAYQRLRASALGRYLEPVWSCMGLHTPAEFNRRHIPACFGGVVPREWIMVYPFVRSYDWYLLDAAERSRIMADHGRNGFAQYPDVKGSTLSAFGMSDYEWVLAFEADGLDRLEGVMHAQRYTEARLHVRVDTPFYTGHRVEPVVWAQRQPRV